MKENWQSGFTATCWVVCALTGRKDRKKRMASVRSTPMTIAAVGDCGTCFIWLIVLPGGVKQGSPTQAPPSQIGPYKLIEDKHNTKGEYFIRLTPKARAITGLQGFHVRSGVNRTGYLTLWPCPCNYCRRLSIHRPGWGRPVPYRVLSRLVREQAPKRTEYTPWVAQCKPNRSPARRCAIQLILRSLKGRKSQF